MSTVQSLLALTAATLMLSTPTWAAGRGAESPFVQPSISSVQVQTAPTPQLLIQGQHLGDASIKVTLGKHVLPVRQSSANQLVVGLPGKLPSATYNLRVTRGNGTYSTSMALSISDTAVLAKAETPATAN